jgi:iron complex outermembrane receptor protein
MTCTGTRALIGRAGVCAAIAAAGFSNAAAAQGGGGVLIEEITVTAQKRAQSAQDVGIAITALSGEQMRALGYTNAQEVTALAPGVSTLQPNGEANYAIAVRGVANNDFTTNVESPVAIYVDEVYISQMSGAGFLLFDVDRVEILRGPQGTLFGRNATGGLVQYVTVKPSREFNGYGSASIGSFNRLKAQGAIGVPLNDVVSARLSVATHQGDGYVENRLRPQSELNNANETAARLQLLFEPGEDVDFLLNARFGQQDIRTGFFEYESAIFPNGMPTPGVPNSNLDGYVDTDGDVFAGDYDFPGRNELETSGFTGTLTWATGAGVLTSITDFQAVERDYIEDSDASPVDYFDFFLTTDADQFSQELRLAGDTERLKWVGGLYYLDLDVSDSNGGITRGLFEALFGDTVENLGFDGVRNPYATKTETWSAFGQLEYALSDAVALIGGWRWIEEDKTHRYRNILSDFPDTATSGLDPNVVGIVDLVAPFTGERNDGNWSARAQIDWTPSGDLLVYGSWNRGVKSGGFNAPLLPTDVFVTDTFMNYGPEQLDAYEFGFKWDTLDARLRLNGAFYYYDYEDYQAFSIIGLDTFTLNAQAENKGFELELQAAPVEGLDLQFGAAYIDADVTDVPGVTKDVETPVGTVLAILPGATVRPVQTPEWNLTGLVRYEFPVRNGHLALQADARYRSEHFFALTQFPAVTEDGYTVTDASITWFPEAGNWSVRFFADNVTDEEYLVQTFDLSGNVDNGGLFGLIERYYGRPRTFGMNVSYSF